VQEKSRLGAHSKEVLKTSSAVQSVWRDDVMALIFCGGDLSAWGGGHGVYIEVGYTYDSQKPLLENLARRAKTTGTQNRGQSREQRAESRA
jgi:hypothetical protein